MIPTASRAPTIMARSVLSVSRFIARWYPGGGPCGSRWWPGGDPAVTLTGFLGGLAAPRKKPGTQRADQSHRQRAPVAQATSCDPLRRPICSVGDLESRSQLGAVRLPARQCVRACHGRPRQAPTGRPAAPAGQPGRHPHGGTGVRSLDRGPLANFYQLDRSPGRV